MNLQNAYIERVLEVRKGNRRRKYTRDQSTACVAGNGNILAQEKGDLRQSGLDALVGEERVRGLKRGPGTNDPFLLRCTRADLHQKKKRKTAKKVCGTGASQRSRKTRVRHGGARRKGKIGGPRRNKKKLPQTHKKISSQKKTTSPGREQKGERQIKRP